MPQILDLQHSADRKADFGRNRKSSYRERQAPDSNSSQGVELAAQLLKAVGAAPQSKPKLKKLLQDLGIGLVVRARATLPKSSEASILQHTIPEEAETVTAGGVSEPTAFNPIQEGLKALDRIREAEGGSMTGAELLRHHHLTSATLHRRRKEHRIVFWQDARHDFHYPVWQFTATGSLVPGIQDVLRIFKSEDATRVMRYFLGRRGQLGNKTPLECLKAGCKSNVIEHACRHYAENTW